MKKKRLYLWALSLAVFCQFAPVHAYPSFVGYGYTSCIVCHFNALGNGPLTDYGRALGATAIAAKPFYNQKADDQKLGDQSAFLIGTVKLPDFLRPQINFRGMTYTTGGSTRFIPMQLDASVVAKFVDDRLVAVINGGMGSSAGKKYLMSREYYVSYAATPRFRVYAGLMDVAYGIRTPDHTSFARDTTKLKQNDQVHGALFHLGTNKAEYALHLFGGHLQQDSNIRPKGGSFTFEIDTAEKIRLGASGLFATSNVRTRKLASIHTRAGIGKGSSLLAEMGFVLDTPKGDPTLIGNYFYTQSMTRLFRGFHFLFTAEYKTRDAFTPNPRTFRTGPSIQYFPTSYAEFRLDLWGARSMGQMSPVIERDSFEVMGQLHLWF